TRSMIAGYTDDGQSVYSTPPDLRAFFDPSPTQNPIRKHSSALSSHGDLYRRESRLEILRIASSLATSGGMPAFLRLYEVARMAACSFLPDLTTGCSGASSNGSAIPQIGICPGTPTRLAAWTIR